MGTNYSVKVRKKDNIERVIKRFIIRVGVDCEVLGDLIVGAGANEFSISESSDDVTISTLVSDKDMIFKVNDGGSATEVFRLDGDVSALKVATDKKILFRDSALAIFSSTDGQLDIDADTEVEIVSPTIDIDASTAVEINTPSLTITSGDDDDPLVIIKNTNSNADSSRLRFVKDGGDAGADSDVIGIIQWFGDDSGQTQTHFVVF